MLGPTPRCQDLATGLAQLGAKSNGTMSRHPRRACQMNSIPICEIGSGWAKEAQSHAQSNPEAGGVSCFGSGPRAPPEAEAAAYTGRDHMPHSCRLFVGGLGSCTDVVRFVGRFTRRGRSCTCAFRGTRRCVLQRGPTRRWLRALGVRLVQVAYINLRVPFVQALGQSPLIGGEFRGITNSPEMPCQARSTLLAQQVKRREKGTSLIGGKSVRFQEHVGSRRKPANKCRTRPGT